jgi:hypothetical protein
MSEMALNEPFGPLQHKLWSKEGPRVKLAIWPLTTKVRNWLDPGVCRWSATYRWKALKESYKFSLDLVPNEAQSEKLWTPKVSKVQTGTISGLYFGSPRTKSHSGVNVVEQHREYYMGEGGGFPLVRAVMSPVSQCCPRLIPTARVFPKMS